MNQLGALQAMCGFLRSHDPSMMVSTLHAVLIIAQDEGRINQKTLALRLGVPTSTSTRICNALSPRQHVDAYKMGLGWLEQRQDPNERRSNLLFLTPAGKLAVQQILQFFPGLERSAS